MKKKLLCGILAALMLIPFAACTQGTTDTATEAPTDLLTEAPTEVPTEEITELETEAETEPPIEIEVPGYEDIGLTDHMAGTDNRVMVHYDFSKYTYSQLRKDNALVFTSNKDYVVDANGLTLTEDGWNSVGFTHTLREEYTAKTSIINRGAEHNVRTVMFGCRVTRSNHLYIDSGLWFTFSKNAVYAHVKNGFTKLVQNNLPFDAKDGLDVTIKDDGTTIQCFVGDTLVAKAVVEGEALAFNNATGKEIDRTSYLA